MEKREFLISVTSAFKNKAEEHSDILIRPPYYDDVSLFYQHCHECDGKCATVCEVEIIKIFEDKTPYLDFKSSGCIFCDDCADACEFGVLDVENKNDINATINISVSSCLAWSDTMCFSCKEPCLENAIIFQGLFKPVIDESKCTACGFCISRCPVLAIDIPVSTASKIK